MGGKPPHKLIISIRPHNQSTLTTSALIHKQIMSVCKSKHPTRFLGSISSAYRLIFPIHICIILDLVFFTNHCEISKFLIFTKHREPVANDFPFDSILIFISVLTGWQRQTPAQLINFIKVFCRKWLAFQTKKYRNLGLALLNLVNQAIERLRMSRRLDCSSIIRIEIKSPKKKYEFCTLCI